MLNVKLQDDLKNYIEKHHYDTISLSLDERDYPISNVRAMNSEIRTVNPKIRFESPRDVNKYDLYDVEGVHVYVDKAVDAYDDTIEIVEHTTLGIHRFQVKGIKSNETIL